MKGEGNSFHTAKIEIVKMLTLVMLRCTYNLCLYLNKHSVVEINIYYIIYNKKDLGFLVFKQTDKSECPV